MDFNFSGRKFGKQIQRRQLDIPEYAASFVDYKALKKLIKKLSSTPVISARDEGIPSLDGFDPPATLQANKDKFFFRLERELEKVNIFYLQKEAELKIRLTSLLDQKRSLQAQTAPVSRLSSRYIALEEGFKQYVNDLNKLQQFVEVNQTAFTKILKKWDKTSKSQQKEVFLARAVEVQPCFNQDVIGDLSDQATTNLQDFADWAEGGEIRQTPNERPIEIGKPLAEDLEIESQLLQAAIVGDTTALREWINRLASSPDANERFTKAFLSTSEEAPEQSLHILLESQLVDLTRTDEINQRNILHKATISGRRLLLDVGVAGNVDARAVDVYGRLPIHYACIHGFVEMIPLLVEQSPETINAKDHDNFTPLIRSIVSNKLDCVRVLLEVGASIDPSSEKDHVPLNLACQHGSAPIVALLLERKPKILPDAEGLYPQHLAARSTKTLDILQMLKTYGADLDQPDHLYQWTPLFHAASEGNVQCLRLLIEECKVNCDAKDEKGLSALYYATWEGHIECIRLLSCHMRRASASHRTHGLKPRTPLAVPVVSSSPFPSSLDAESIPPITLPPPIMPLRRYGHNFLDSKTFVVLNFGDLGYEPIQFYDDNKYPAARLTISSKSSDLIPRNLLLPIQDEFKTISFQIDNVDTFSLDFDIYPTFGARVIARAVASSRIFTSKTSSSGRWHLELLDLRLRTIGRISFNFQVVRPFPGVPLEITNFATYWKATTNERNPSDEIIPQSFSPSSAMQSLSSNLSLGSHHHTPSTLKITGSSLSGSYVRLFVQLTADNVPVLYPHWRVSHYGLDVPISNLTASQFSDIGASQQNRVPFSLDSLKHATISDTPALSSQLAKSFATLSDVLSAVPLDINVELHCVFPRRAQAEQLRLTPNRNINEVADAVLRALFEHARRSREGEHDGTEHSGRGVVFSSSSPELCIALNWKQPNYPVLLCSELDPSDTMPPPPLPRWVSSTTETATSHVTLSVKEAVQVAQSNNFMGLICSSRLLALAPALITTIKNAGLVLVEDIPSEPSPRTSLHGAESMDVDSDRTNKVWERGSWGRGSGSADIDGTLTGNAVLRFVEGVGM
ncbi:ankyrin repeat protein nuc-2 [Eremomyces bilateralis CBS 781.70]|uniref:Ankyrin repeat protein nuc-2 n=1 Tax=Eremomyces bilateralis CBS 781.70 TaxID=1392243 RepID=A0A6G1FZK1_9PEZI|nr:ankyrin repeat protein nuc-2 [Eremomyces bilateralis CBS 781.70]KAF1811111.1 ankyrin repeat protein nuc-2 [Eremomyces bilateralis CBS 781.70]